METYILRYTRTKFSTTMNNGKRTAYTLMRKTGEFQYEYDRYFDTRTEAKMFLSLMGLKIGKPRKTKKSTRENYRIFFGIQTVRFWEVIQL